MSKDTFYFSHDYNARNDSKIKKLISVHGYTGYGLYWAIIEDLYNNTNVLPLDYESISFDLRTTPPIIESIINDFNLFVIEDNLFGSRSVEKRLEERENKSKKARESVLKRWNKDTNVLPTNNDSNTIKESKGKENKEKEEDKSSMSFDFKKFLEYFNKITGRKLRVIDNKTKTQINARLKDGYTKEDISKAIKNCMNDEYHKEINLKYLTPEFITRSDKLSKYSSMEVKKPIKKIDPKLLEQLRATGGILTHNHKR